MLNDEEKKALDNLMTLFVGDILSAEEAKEGDVGFERAIEVWKMRLLIPVE